MNRCPSCGDPQPKCPTCEVLGNDVVARVALGKVCDALGLPMDTASDDIVQVIRKSQGYVQALYTEIAELHADLAASGRDPFGPTAQWRGGTFCGNESCPCAAPNLPCREWAGCAETGAYCPCCGWNEAAHRIAREARRRRVRVRLAERPVVAKVRQIRSGVMRGWWDVSVGGDRWVNHYPRHEEAVVVAHYVAERDAKRQAVTT